MSEENLDDLINSQVQEKSELGEVFDNFDNDKHDEKRNVSAIDFNTNLNEMEIKGIAVFDAFKSLHILPDCANIANTLKRLNISKGGWGREGKIKVATAGHEAVLAGKSGGFLSKMFQRRE